MSIIAWLVFSYLAIILLILFVRWIGPQIAEVEKRDVQCDEEIRQIDVPNWIKYVLPLIHRSYTQLITDDIVNVQPMPRGHIFCNSPRLKTDWQLLRADELRNQWGSNVERDLISNCVKQWR